MKKCAIALAVGGALLTASLGCNTPSTPTPAGTSLLKTTFTDSQGGPPPALSGIAPTRHVSKIKVADGAAELEVHLDTVEGPDGRFIQGVELIVRQSGDGTLTATVPTGFMPINRGTAEHVLASVPITINWVHVRYTSTTLRQSNIEIRGDGTVI